MADMFEITFKILDAGGDKARLTYHAAVSSFQRTGDADPYVIVQDYAHYLAQQLDLIILGAIIDISIRINPGLPTGIKTVPDILSDVEEQLDVVFPAVGGVGGYHNRIPTFDHSLFGYGKKILDPDVWQDFWRPLVEVDAPGWNNDNGGISDSRGVEVHSEPIAKKYFNR